MMIEFHTWIQSFMTLFLTLVGGFPFDEMRQIAPVSSVVFTIAWVLIMVMILSNMFVAILTEWYYRINEEQLIERMKISQECGHSIHAHPIQEKLQWLTSLYRGRSKGLNGKAAEAERNAKEVRKMLRRADLRDVDHVRQALVHGERLVAMDLARHFGGSVYTACGFVQRVRELAEVNGNEVGGFGAEKEDIETKEQEEVK